MRNFKYRNAPDLKSALAILAEEKANAWIIAGGTNVLPSIRSQNTNNRTLVDIRGIEALRGIKYSRGKITMGALTTLMDIEKSDVLQKHAHALWQSAFSFADPSTRNSATVGGNICNGSPAADTVVPLLVFDAMLTLEKKGGSREVLLREFFLGKGKMVIEPDEILTKITFTKSSNSAFLKLGLRNAMSISAANFAAALDTEGNKVKNVRIATGCLSPFPTRALHAEKVVEGQELTPEILEKMGEALNANDIQPHDGMRASAKYRRQVAPVLVGRVLKSARDCGKGGAN